MRVQVLIMVVMLGCGSSNGGASDAGVRLDGAPGSCGPNVSDDDCRACGPPPDSVCASGLNPPAPACTDPTPWSDRCCFVGLGQYCSCSPSSGRWGVVVCDPPPRTDDGGWD